VLPKRYRLRHSADLERVRQQGQSWRHPLVILLVITNAHSVSRFGLIASRRVGKATVRNRARRLLRETLRCHVDEIKPGWDCLFIARPPIAQATFAQVEAAVLQLLARANLLISAKETPAPQAPAPGPSGLL